MVIDTDVQALRLILEHFDKDTVKKAVEGIGLIQSTSKEAKGKAIKKKVSDFTLSERGGNFKSQAKKDTNVVPYATLKEISFTERIVDDAEFLPAHFLEEGALALRSVARVNIGNRGFGTGFLISPSLFMTNNHVISTSEEAQESRFEFNYQYDYHGNLQSVDTYTANPTSFFYTNEPLDYTIVRLNDKGSSELSATEGTIPSQFHMSGSPPGGFVPGGASEAGEKSQMSAGERWGYLRLRVRKFAENQLCNIIQHPEARYKEVALHDNRLTRVLPYAVRYRTDTEPGSSGSPVFDNEWDIIAIHHAGGDQDPQNPNLWLNNEGIRIDKIIEDLKQSLQDNPSNQAVLSELGINTT